MEEFPLESDAVVSSSVLSWLLAFGHVPAAIVGVDRAVLYASKSCLKLLQVDSMSAIAPEYIVAADDEAEMGKGAYRFRDVEGHRQDSIGISWQGKPAKLFVFVRQPADRSTPDALNAQVILNTNEKTSLPFEPQQHQDFLAVLSHELRNPVAALAGGFELMKADEFARDTCDNVSPLITDQLNHIRQLLDDLLDVARVQHKKLSINVQAIELKSVINNVVAAHRYSCAKKSQHIDVHLTESPVIVNADVTRIDQVIGNIIDNASRFSPDNSTIEVRLEVKDKQAVISVKDYGIGIEEEFFKKIFHPFAQASRSTKVPLSGLGVGLSLSRELMRLHGGDVTFTSEGSNRGSTFFVTIPIVGKLPTAVQPGAVATLGQKILVVEDSIAIQTVLKRLLSKLGHDVTVVSSGEEAIEMLTKNSFDAALVDIQLPGISGHDVATWVRARDGSSPSTTFVQSGNVSELVAESKPVSFVGPLLQKVPALIAVTGFAQPEDKVRALNAGFDAHLSKPVNLAVLADTLRQFVRP